MLKGFDMKGKGKNSSPGNAVRLDDKLYSALVKAAEIDRRQIRVVAAMAVEDWLNKNHPELLKK